MTTEASIGEKASATTIDVGVCHAIDRPVIGVVVPLFKHSVLIGDAIASIVGQITALPCVAVVVSDGCPFQDSDQHVKALRAAHPGLIRYLVRPNGGLSAARNTGIDDLLTNFPSIQAVYFLDADNLLRARSIDSAYARLMEQPEPGWVYPNIDMFGLRRSFDYAGPYSSLKHLFYNVCEAGSLVHRRVLEAGARFDESMRSGYEDWEFWLSATQAGFSGVHHPHFGFLYRNRAESMLSQSKRDDEAIRAYVRRKHKTLLNRDHIQALQSREAPQHAIFFLDTADVLVGFDARTDPVMTPRAAFDTLLWRNIVSPGRQHIPPVMLFTTRTLFDEMSRAGVMPWIVHDCEMALETQNVACLEIDAASGSFYALRPGREPRRCAVLAIKRDLLVSIIMDTDTAWLDRLPMPDPDMKVASKMLVLPRRPGAEAGTAGVILVGFMFCVMGWRESGFREAARHAWEWRERSVPHPHDLFLDVRRSLSSGVLFPCARTGERAVGFVLSVGGFGGAERVAHNVAAQFAANGWSTHLFMLGTDRVEMPDELAGSYTSISFLDGAAFGSFDQSSQYQGTALPSAGKAPADVARLVGLLGWLDVVINCHSGALNAAAAILRQHGTITATHLHLLDHSPRGRPVGHPILGLAYEHAYDLVLCCSNRLMEWMHAAGVPADKLVLVPNAPGYPLATATQQEIVTRRGAGRAGRLRVLFLGRLDRQKGIGRLADVVAETRRQGLPIDWRIVGSAAVDAATVPPVLRNMTEPPVYRADQLTALFAATDVMLLLSDFEGVPLSILEAQRLGVVVIATDVGAVNEVIESGVNGLLVPLDTAVADTVDLLRLFVRFPTMVSAIGQAAANVRGWPDACAGLLARLNAVRPAEPQSRSAGAATAGHRAGA